jgi:hypothetical protein
MIGFMVLGIWVRDVAVFHSNVLSWQSGELRKQLEEVTRDRQ